MLEIIKKGGEVQNKTVAPLNANNGGQQPTRASIDGAELHDRMLWPEWRPVREPQLSGY